MTPALDRRVRAALRIALSHQVLNGLSAALGLLLISAGVRFFIDPFAASVAAVGVIVCIPPDRAAPRHGRFWQMLPAALFGLPLFLGMQAIRADPVALGLLLVPATFLAFLAGAWGKRGLPIAMSIMFAMIFSMAVPPRPGDAAMDSGLYFAMGAGLYLVWSTLANAVLNARYRTLMLADTLLSLVDLVRTQASQFAPAAEAPGGHAPLIGRLLREQAALADQLQTARDLLLESPRTPRRLQLAGMLLLILEMRDHLLACELDLDILKTHSGHEPVLVSLRDLLEDLAGELERLTDAMLLGRRPAAMADRRTELAAAPADDDLAAAGGTLGAPSPAALARGLTNRVLHINDETLRLVALARGEAEPDLALVRSAWQMFVSPTTWSWAPLGAVWRWDAPTLRHAIRAALAVGSAYALSFALPWRAHDYWILLTIVVVLRGSLAQTLERRNSRVLGTLVGCLLAAALLWGHLPPLALLLLVSLAQAVAHAFAIKKYLVTAIAATVLGLVQAHLLNAGTSPAFDVVERMADTLIGVAIAWVFSYVLPSWERSQLPALVTRTLSAQARHARVALGLGQLQAVDNEPELAWRLERREAYDSLSALVQATQRSLSEPRAVRPPLAPLGRLLAHSYQLLAQLTAVKTMLLLRRGQLNADHIREPLRSAAETIEATLLAKPAAAAPGRPSAAAWAGPAAPEPERDDLTPWALRRLDLAEGVAVQLRQDADEVVSALAQRAT
jgi:uncharacterized membrane protein YccC